MYLVLAENTELTNSFVAAVQWRDVTGAILSYFGSPAKAKTKS